MLKSNRHRKAEFAALLVALFAASANSAMADSKWEKTHPRRDQVNDRLAHQNHRITQERKEGDMTKEQAVALRKQDHQIRKEERTMAAQHDGHITKSEQHALNQQENSVSQQIGK